MEEFDAREALCRRCGMCCHKKITTFDGSVMIHPTAVCEHLDENNLCRVYENRPCVPHEQMIETDGLLPPDCPYAALRPGYVPARVATIEEFDHFLAMVEAMRQALEGKMKQVQEETDA